MNWMPHLKTRGEGMPELPPMERLNGPEVFRSMDWETTSFWSDARLKPLVVYLRGNKSLDLPPEWRAAFPGEI